MLRLTKHYQIMYLSLCFFFWLSKSSKLLGLARMCGCESVHTFIFVFDGLASPPVIDGSLHSCFAESWSNMIFVHLHVLLGEYLVLAMTEGKPALE